MTKRNLRLSAFICGFLYFSLLLHAQSRAFQSSDYLKLHSAGQASLSPDGARLAYTVARFDGPHRPYGELFTMDLATGKSIQVGEGPAGDAVWSPDGRLLAYHGRLGDKGGLIVANADGSNPRFLAETEGTNTPLPYQGYDLAWSPDSKQIAYVSAVPGPEANEATGDPVVITRYLYKPDAGEGSTRFGDNRRLHIFIVDIASAQSRQLTTGTHNEHSIDWSPNGQDIVFLTSHDFDEDWFFNYDIFTVRVSDGSLHRLTASESAEYVPRYSPDGKMIAFLGTRRGLTDRETTMEDTHVWLMNADGSNRRELGAIIDNRQGEPVWSPDGSSLYFSVQERGSSHLYRVPVAGGRPEVVISDAGHVGDYSLAKGGKLAYTFSPPNDMSELFVRSPGAPVRKQVFNQDLFSDKDIAPVESYTFLSNDNKWEVEAFLTKPLGWRPDGRYPLIVNIHGGPHGANGPSFNFKNQVYAGLGWATLNVNYRGSTSYGQKFADAVFRDQDGDEGMDVLYAVNAALRRYTWLDPDRMGIEGVSYGGQLTDWLITQTNEFKAAIPIAGISNLISYNYMTYYNQYEAMEWGAYPHQGNLMDVLWERSALKHVAAAHTPTMLMHGENDNDVPIAEAEQFYIALKDVGTEAIFVRYPREGHGIRENRHVVDSIDRCIDWYEKHFAKPASQ